MEPLDPATLPRPYWSTDSGRLTLAGGALVALATLFCWNDLSIPAEYLLSIAGGVVLVLSLVSRNNAMRTAASWGLVGVACVGTAWHAYAPTLPLTLGLLCCGVIGIVHVALDRSSPDELSIRSHAWISAALAALAASWSAYYQFATLGFAAETSSRRLVLTLAWLVSGLVGMVLGTRKHVRGLRDAGALVASVAVGKALFYDSMHLAGMERVGLCALAGVALIVGAAIVKPAQAA